ncbi:hypothetical protein JHK85_021393 [Glycine max]|nr:hypothetical protein JHK85_021393 [Glycine max]
MALSTVRHNHFLATHEPGLNRFNMVRAQHHHVLLDHPKTKTPNRATRLAESLSHVLHLHIDPTSHKNLDLLSVHEEKHSTPTMSPRENISQKWREIQGYHNWEDILDPLQPWLRREIVKYGEFAQATYDAFDYDSFSEYCGSCRYNQNKLFEKLGLTRNSYTVTRYIYAMSHIELPRWLERSHVADTWSKDSNWIGFVAVSDDDETRRIGRRDIVVAWRGTVAPCEWYEDFQRKLDPIGHGDAKVEHGFLSIYKSKSETTRYNKSSASDQVMKEVTKLVNFYKGKKGEEVSLTITGHSLGGALALINAYEVATTFLDLPVSVISFGAPRVGNIAFKDELHQMGVKLLRVVVKQDWVPKMPGLLFNEKLKMFDEITGLEWVYTHVGAELALDVHSSPYLKGGMNLSGFHSLETYLHLIDGYLSHETPFRSEARRDIALVNKSCDMLVDELRIPHCWYQLANKGLVCNAHGRWVKPKRDNDDIPSHASEVFNAGLGVIQDVNITVQTSYKPALGLIRFVLARSPALKILTFTVDPGLNQSDASKLWQCLPFGVKVLAQSGALESLISGCPLLTNLQLSYCSGFEHIDVSAPFLQFLMIEGDEVIKSICLKEPHDLILIQLFADGPGDNIDRAWVADLLEDSPNVERLFLGTSYIKCNSMAVELQQILDVFDYSNCYFNLLQDVKITVKTSYKPALDLIRLVLARSPALKILTFRVGLGLNRSDASVLLSISCDLLQMDRASPRAKVKFLYDDLSE